jgi:methyltransferase OMS1, mitochondrial
MVAFAPYAALQLRRKSTSAFSLAPVCRAQIQDGQGTGTFSVSRRTLLTAAAALAVAAAKIATTRSSASAAALETARAYDTYAAQYDILDGGSAALPRALGFSARRAAIVSRAAGVTLEIACGSGANFALYASAPRVHNVVALDVSQGMLNQAASARAAARAEKVIELVRGDAGALPYADETFDTVLDTFSMCVLDEPVNVLREMARVLKRSPDSRVLLLEHSVSSVVPVALFQNITAKSVASSSKGCFWNQDVVGLAREAGLYVVSSESSFAGTLVSLELRRMDST